MWPHGHRSSVSALLAVARKYEPDEDRRGGHRHGGVQVGGRGQGPQQPTREQ